ncbi:hypothetical protein BC826DRAFT_979092 [Russula brevipes]|nr:hypothetical protein BC826DRAFT_979092 [Russula brevipes]
MLPIYQILLVAVHAASVALIAFPQVSPSSAAAKPISRSLSSRAVVVHHANDRPVRVLKSKNSKADAFVSHDLHPSPANVSHHPHAHSASTGPHVPGGAYGRSGDVNVDNKLDILNDYCLNANKNAQTLKKYSSQASASKQKGTPHFEQRCASALTDFHTNSQGFTTTLQQLGAYKGRLNYNQHDLLERLINGLVDAHKDTLSYIAALIYHDPFLGPIIGPTVYEIKCIVDELLNAVENLTDAIINDCKPAILKLVGEYGIMACKSAVEVAGICL